MRHDIDELTAIRGIIRAVVYSGIMYMAIAIFIMWRIA